MKKNKASQSIGAQMVATDGSAFTGSVTVYVTGDNGTQAVGSVGSGACTHEGNGYHSYAPAQAETNYDHVAFTFVGTGAVPATIQVFTKSDSESSIHATGTLSGTHSSTTADLGTNAPSTDIKGFTLYIPSRGFIKLVDSYDTGTGVATFATTSATLTNGDAWILFATPQASSANPVYSIVSEILASALADMFNTDSGTTYASAVAGSVVKEIADNATGGGLDAAGVRAAVGLASANLDTQLADIPTVAEMNARTLASADYASATNLATVDAVVDGIKAKTDSLTFTVAGQVDANVESINATTVLGNGSSGSKWRA